MPVFGMFNAVIADWNMERTGQTFTNGSVHRVRAVRLDWDYRIPNTGLPSWLALSYQVDKNYHCDGSVLGVWSLATFASSKR